MPAPSDRGRHCEIEFARSLVAYDLSFRLLGLESFFVLFSGALDVEFAKLLEVDLGWRG